MNCIIYVFFLPSDSCPRAPIKHLNSSVLHHEGALKSPPENSLHQPAAEHIPILPITSHKNLLTQATKLRTFLSSRWRGKDKQINVIWGTHIFHINIFSEETFILGAQCIISLGIHSLGGSKADMLSLRPPKLLSADLSDTLMELRDVFSHDSVLELTASFMFNLFVIVP